MKGTVTNLLKTNHFIGKNTYICEPWTSHSPELPVSGHPSWLSNKNRSIQSLMVALLVFLFAVVSGPSMVFASPIDGATWRSSLNEGAMAVENRRGPNPINRLVPINPGIGSPSGRLESDGGSGTGNYHLEIPLISLPGRGIDLTVTANYNSQIWSTLDVNERGGDMFSYDQDGDWPVPGFNLGFGKVVFFEDYGLFIHSNGTRQVLSKPQREIINGQFTKRAIAKFTDGTLGMFACPALKYDYFICSSARNTANVSLENGQQIEMLTLARGNENAFYPVKILDAHGNFIQIDYRKDSSGNPDPPHIDRITDSVGRIVQFHYDDTGLPTAITGPDQGSGNRVYARLYYRKINSAVSVPRVRIPTSHNLKLDFHALDAIYFPGNHTGYGFTDYTPYGIPKTVSVNRDMSASIDSSQIAPLQRDLDQAKTHAASFQPAINAAQAAYKREAEEEPEKTIENQYGKTLRNPAWTAWKQRMDGLLAVLNQAKANALPAQQALTTAQSAYDAAIQLQPPQTIENEIERTSFSYDTANLIAATASPTGYSPIVDPSTPRGLVSRVTRWLARDSRSISESGGNLRGIHTDLIYDQTGNLRIVKDSPTGQLSYNYDSQTNYSLPSSIAYGAADPNNQLARNTTSIMYDLALGLPVRVTDENGISRQITYKPGAPGWRTNTVTMSTGTKTTVQYNDSFLSATSKVADAEGRIHDQIFRYDGRGLLRETRRLRCTDGGHDIVEYRYDNMGRKIRQSLLRRTTESNTSTQWIDSTYDTAGRLTTITGPNGTVSKWFYNEPAMPHGVPVGTLGPTVRVVGPWDRESWTISDALGRMRYIVKSDPNTGKVSDSGSQLAEQLYDARGLLTRLNYGSQMRRFQHDSLGRLTGVTVPERAARLDRQGNYSPGGGSYSDIYQYDDQSNLVTHIDPRGARSIFTYANDPLNRLQSVSYDLRTIGDTSSKIWETPSTTFDYVQTGDLRRPRTMTTKGVVQESYTYSAESLPATITTKFDAAPNSLLTMSMQYDSMGRPTVFRYPERYENGNTHGVNQLDYLYSKDGELARINLDGGTLIDNVRYTTAGMTHVELFNQGVSLSEDYAYDPQSGRLRIQMLTNNSNPQQQPLLNLSYDYRIPQVLGETGQLTHQDSLAGNPAQKSHTYDAWGRLTSSILKTGTVDSIRQTYSYDIYGNRITVQAQQWNPMPAGWVDLPDANADGMSAPVNSSNQIQKAGYLHDGAGNLVQGPGPGGRMQHYMYDAAGRLVRVEDDNHNLIEAYQYGADRRRVAVSTDGHTWRLSLWKGHREMARYDLQAGTGALNWVDRPIYFGSRLLAEMQRTQTGATLKMFHPDHRDSVVTTEVSAGALHLKHQCVLAYGSDKTPTDQIDGDRRFTSYRRSARTGLDYAMNRDYDSKLGRFIQPDPLGMGSFNVGDPQTLNAYTYVKNDPVNQVDPLGLKYITVVRAKRYDWSSLREASDSWASSPSSGMIGSGAFRTGERPGAGGGGSSQKDASDPPCKGGPPCGARCTGRPSMANQMNKIIEFAHEFGSEAAFEVAREYLVGLVSHHLASAVSFLSSNATAYDDTISAQTEQEWHMQDQAKEWSAAVPTREERIKADERNYSAIGNARRETCPVY